MVCISIEGVEGYVFKDCIFAYSNEQFHRNEVTNITLQNYSIVDKI